jgi:VanZ family protein
MAVTVAVSDKIEHFGAYGLLSVFLYLNLSFQNKIKIFNKFPATFTVLIASLYGLLDELHQLFVPGRSAEFLDWFADFSGSLIAVLIVRFLILRIREIENKKNSFN